MVKPYSEQGEKKSQVKRMFDRIAPWYDFLNHFLSVGIDRKWRRTAVRQLKGLGPKNILDVATGTADLALEARRQFPAANITGIDLSDEMIRLGNRKLAKKEIEDLKLMVGDSENLPFANNTFDAITVAFGVRNFGDLQAGLKEMHRVLSPGGRLVVLEFSQPKSFPFKQFFGLYFKYVLPLIGRLWSKDEKAYGYLYESSQAFPAYEKFEAILEENGFKSLYYKILTLGICCVYVAEK